MSEERKNKLRKRLLWTAIVLLVIYPLSSGPVMLLGHMTGCSWLGVLYFPLFWLGDVCPPFGSAFGFWLVLWMPSDWFHGMIG
jgi:hypothetical protein